MNNKLVAKLTVVVISVAIEAVPIAIKAYKNRPKTHKMQQRKLARIDNTNVTVITIPR